MKGALNFCTLVFALVAVTFSTPACARQERVTRTDCGISFVAPKEFAYIEVENPRLDNGTACIVAFKRQNKHATEETVGLSEGWREQVDHVLEIKTIPLKNSLEAYSLRPNASGGYDLTTSTVSEDPVRFKLTSATPLDIKNGSGLIADLEAITRPSSMIERGVRNRIILAAGNARLSVDYALWPSSKEKYSASDVAAMTSLFKSIEFLNP